jgi:hypothetical protein
VLLGRGGRCHGHHSDPQGLVSLRVHHDTSPFLLRCLLTTHDTLLVYRFVKCFGDAFAHAFHTHGITVA